MTASMNKAIVQRAFDGLAQADPVEFLAAMSDDLVWIITGSSEWSGRFEGKEAVQRDLIAPLFRLFATPYYTRADRIIADDEGNVVVLAKGEVRTRSGQDCSNDYCFVLRLRDGRIVEIREYMDSALAERALGSRSPPIETWSAERGKEAGMYEGGCECGHVRYRLTSGPIFVNCCHCRQCQKLSGSAFAINAMIEADRVEPIAGGDVVGADGTARCPDCGALLWALHPMFGDAVRFVRVGTLDEGEKLPPDAHFFVRSKHPWIAVPAGTPVYETLPGPDDPPLFGPEAQARLKAVTG